MKKFLHGLLVMFLCATLFTGVATGTTIKDDMTFEGPVTFKGSIDQSGANMTVTPAATGYLNIKTGNLKVGNGTPTTTLNGEDAYVEGTFEVDGVPRFDNTSMIIRGVTYTLPAADGTAGQALTTDGSAALTWAAAGGVTLDGAYDYGGAGSGRTITADSGTVEITNAAADNNDTLAVSKSPVGAQAGDAIAITMSANATGSGINISNAGSGNDITGTSASWGITKAGVATFSSLAGLTSGVTINGGTINLNASSNNATNINTGTSTGTVTIGGSLNSVGIDSSSWDISTAGAVSGVTTLGMSGDLTISAGDVNLANGQAVKGSTTNAETIKFQAYDVDNTTYRDAITLTNGNTVGIAIGSNNETVAINSADWDISATGDMTGIGAITSNGLFTGALGATISGATINLNASSNFGVNIGTGTSTGQVDLGSGASAQTLNVGTGAGAKTVSVGSTNTTSSTAVSSGSGGVNVNVSNNQPTNINSGTSTGTVTIGNTTPAIVNVLGTVSVNTDAAALATNVGAGSTTGTITIGGAGAQTLDIGNGAAAKTVNLGSSNTTSTTTILSGTGGILANNNNNQPVGINTGTSTGTTTIGNALSIVTVAGIVSGGTPFIFEGATANDHETTLAIADPTADRTITLPDYTGGVPLVIAQDATQTSQAGAGTADVTGSSLSMASGWFSAGKTLKYTITGTKTGANAAMIVHLYLLDAAVMSLTASDGAAGDWTATFIVHEYTDTAHQKITGILNVNGKVSVVDYATATKDMAAGATTIKAQIQSQNAGDTVTTEYVNIEHWVK
ncbi:MAG: hypothetical protein PHU49_08705 [Syntrophorhabdaceae bacterium]|nr:hypothetical protein [Syntrophorhabdaceae bacterium]